jgi:hypothetical protein
MIVGRIKDVVRTGIGREDLHPDLLSFFLDSGLRMIEKKGNFYWMRDEVDFSLTIDDQDYTISASPVSISAYKDTHVMLAKAPSDVVYYEVPWAEKEQLDQVYSSDDSGWPEAYYVDQDDVLYFYPKPDVAYNIRMVPFVWTNLPTSNLVETHEILKRFPEALIYASIAFGLEWLTHNPEQIAPWTQKLAVEMLEIKRQDHRRKQLDNINFMPSRGPYIRRAVLKWRQW